MALILRNHDLQGLLELDDYIAPLNLVIERKVRGEV